MTSAQLSVVGTGFQIAGHVTAETEAVMRRADRLFHVVSDQMTRDWIDTLNPRAESLYDAYAVGRPRVDSYREMVARILSPLESGAHVCAIFYGHPGVYAWPGHEAIRRARAAGIPARMLPAISAEDCLYADLEVDPGLTGSQSYEASDFLSRQRVFDPCCALVLWQIGGIAVRDFRWDGLWNPDGLIALKERLLEAFPADHEVIVYRATGLPIGSPHIERIPLFRLEDAEVVIASTLFVPPLRTARGTRPGSRAIDFGRVTPSQASGSLTAVGLGYKVAGHVPLLSRRLMEQAERLFYLVVDPITGFWLRDLNPTATSLHLGYVAGEPSQASVDVMVATVMEAVEAGHDTVLATNGHAAIYMHLTHEALARTRAGGRRGRIVPGVSIEDCLIADLGIDPAMQGRTLLEATHFARFTTVVDTSTSLVLLQPGAVGVDYYRPGLEAYRPGLVELVEALARFYPPDHPIRIYETMALPIASPVTHTVPLRRLLDAPVTVRSTLWVPPLAPAPRDHAMLARLLDHAEEAQSAKVAS